MSTTLKDRRNRGGGGDGGGGCESRSRSRSRSRSTSRSPSTTAVYVDSSEFYDEYHGHKIEHLNSVLTSMRSNNGKKERRAIFLAGDSSLDNKFWFPNSLVDAVNGMENVLKPAQSRRDIAYWLNRKSLLCKTDNEVFTINASVEEARIESRARETLLKQVLFHELSIQNLFL